MHFGGIRKPRTYSNKQLCQQDFRCPLCKKSVADMSPVWQQMAHEMAAQPMPPEAARRVRILCHDCTEHSQVGRRRASSLSRAAARCLFDDAALRGAGGLPLPRRAMPDGGLP